MLNAIQRSLFDAEVQRIIGHVINKRGQTGNRDVTLANSINRSMSNRAKWYGGGAINQLYQNEFNGSANEVYKYIVANYRDRLEAEGIIQPPPAPEPAPEPQPQPEPAPAPQQQGPGGSNKLLLFGAAAAGLYFISKN